MLGRARVNMCILYDGSFTGTSWKIRGSGPNNSIKTCLELQLGSRLLERRHLLQLTSQTRALIRCEVVVDE